MSLSRRETCNHKMWPIRLVFLYTLLLAFGQSILYTHISDIGFDDESGYLSDGLNFFHSGPPTAENSPLYAIWYWIESCFINDPVTLYQANWCILLIVILMIFLVALRTAGVSIIGTTLALAYASVSYYMYTWPYVTGLSAALVLLATLTILHAQSPARSYSAAAAVVAIAAFIRPELLIAYLVLLAVATYHSWRERKWTSLILPAVIFGTLCVTFGAPLGGGRSMVAFGQHYAMNVAQYQHLNIDYWNYWQQFVKADFGEASTPLQAMATNPRAFLWHITRNIMKLPQGAFLLTPSFYNWSIEVRIVIGALVAILVFSGVIYGVAHAIHDEKGRRLVVMLLTLLIPCLITSLLISPRLHYFMAPLAVLCVLAGYGLSTAHFNLPGWLLCLALLPLIFMTLAWIQASPNAPNLATIRVLRTLSVPSHGSILESDFGSSGKSVGNRHAPGDRGPV